MAQHDYVIENAAGAAVRADMNNLYQAIAEVNSGTLEPATKFPYMFWADTTTNLLKQRNGGNTAWVIRNALGTVRVISKSVNYTVALADFGSIINCTSTFTLSFTAAATLGTNFWFDVKNTGTGVITLDPSTAELIDGVATLTLQSGRSLRVYCDGTSFITVGRSTAVNIASFIDGAHQNISNVIVSFDDTEFINTEGTQIMSFVYTPLHPNSTLHIDVMAQMNLTSLGLVTAALGLFQNSDVNALAVGSDRQASATSNNQVTIYHKITTPGTTPITFKVRGGYSSGDDWDFNGSGIIGLYNGKLASFIRVTEVFPQP